MARKNKLKVLIVASEVSPYVKSGGLGDVMGSLPVALAGIGVDARVCLPLYSSMGRGGCNYIASFDIDLGWRKQSASIYEIKDASVPTYAVENDFYFGRDGLYGYGDDHERFAFFSKASIELLNFIDFIPDVIHFNDWQTAIGCVYLKDIYSRFVFFKNIKTLFTIHNLQYQGLYNRYDLSRLDLNDGYFVSDKFEFFNNICLMKGGIVYADAISTVSPTYSYEIQTPAYGHDLDGVLRQHSGKLHGILNGIDMQSFDPSTDGNIPFNFSNNDEVRYILDKKRQNKAALQERLGLDVTDAPMFAIISRLVDQKGLGLVSIIMEELLSRGAQLVVLGTGDGHYEHLFKHFAWRFPQQVSANIFFSDELARNIYASADLFLMPSMFEPCGLGQLFAMRYGTIPIVRNTGGLVDTVQHFSVAQGNGNGFVFNDYIASGLMWAINEALHVFYNDKKAWGRLVKNAMGCDFSWGTSAEQYKELYASLKKLY